jgi:hypothetical protein
VSPGIKTQLAFALPTDTASIVAANRSFFIFIFSPLVGGEVARDIGRVFDVHGKDRAELRTSLLTPL